MFLLCGARNWSHQRAHPCHGSGTHLSLTMAALGKSGEPQSFNLSTLLGLHRLLGAITFARRYLSEYRSDRPPFLPDRMGREDSEGESRALGHSGLYQIATALTTPY